MGTGFSMSALISSMHAELVVRLRIAEVLLKFRLPRAVGCEGVTLRAAARGVERR